MGMKKIEKIEKTNARNTNTLGHTEKRNIKIRRTEKGKRKTYREIPTTQRFKYERTRPGRSFSPPVT